MATTQWYMRTSTDDTIHRVGEPAIQLQEGKRINLASGTVMVSNTLAGTRDIPSTTDSNCNTELSSYWLIETDEDIPSYVSTDAMLYRFDIIRKITKEDVEKMYSEEPLPSDSMYLVLLRADFGIHPKEYLMHHRVSVRTVLAARGISPHVLIYDSTISVRETVIRGKYMRHFPSLSQRLPSDLYFDILGRGLDQAASRHRENALLAKGVLVDAIRDMGTSSLAIINHGYYVLDLIEENKDSIHFMHILLDDNICVDYIAEVSTNPAIKDRAGELQAALLDN